MTTTRDRPTPSTPDRSLWHGPETPVQIGVSSCLLGDEVRFDGRHKRSLYVSDVLGAWVRYIKVCPEVESGMSIPRPPIRLEEVGGEIRLRSPETGEDFTDSMRAFGSARSETLGLEGLDGFILKSGSPSCGTGGLPIHQEGKESTRTGQGFFAEAVTNQCPLLPMEEEGRLLEPHHREHFLDRVFCRNRWRNLTAHGLTRQRLIEFHTAHKLLLLAHDESAYRRLGRMLGSAGTLPDSELFSAYEAEFHDCLRTRATPSRHINVLQHALGHFKHLIESRERKEVLLSLSEFEAGLVPRSVPIGLFQQLIHTHPVDWLRQQLYFCPHPSELTLPPSI